MLCPRVGLMISVCGPRHWGRQTKWQAPSAGDRSVFLPTHSLLIWLGRQSSPSSYLWGRFRADRQTDRQKDQLPVTVCSVCPRDDIVGVWPLSANDQGSTDSVQMEGGSFASRTDVLGVYVFLRGVKGSLGIVERTCVVEPAVALATHPKMFTM